MWSSSFARSFTYVQRIIPEEFSKFSFRYAHSCNQQLQQALWTPRTKTVVVAPHCGPRRESSPRRMGGKKTHYVVKKGRKPGIYREWEEAKQQVNGYKGAVYKGFTSEAEAYAWAGREAPSNLPSRSRNLATSTRCDT